MEEIMEVLKLCMVQGIQAYNPGVSILAEENENRSVKRSARAPLSTGRR
jgi:hypothetical protein